MSDFSRNTRFSGALSDEALGSALRALTPPQRSEQQWDALRNSLFERLDTRKSQQKEMPIVSLPFLTPWVSGLSRTAKAAGVISLLVVATLVTVQVGVGSRPLPAVVMRVQGHVEALRGKNHRSARHWWEPVSVLSDVRKGQVFQTGMHGALSIGLGAGTGVELGAETALGIEQADSKDIVLFLYRGAVTAEVRPREKGQQFVIVTPNATCRVIGTAFRVDVGLGDGSNDVHTALTVIRGEVAFSSEENSKETVAVHEGQRVVATGPKIGLPEPLDDHGIYRELMSLRHSLSKYELAEDLSHGLLHIGSVPEDAEIYVNGHHEGSTPSTIMLPSGETRISINYLNYEPFDTMITVDPLVEHQLSVSLNPEGIAQSHEPQMLADPVVRSKSTNRTRNRPEVASAPEGEQTESLVVSRKEYISAVEATQHGDYAKAIAQLELLLEQDDISHQDRVRILDQVVLCVKRMGDYRKLVESLETLYGLVGAESGRRKDLLLWEIITIKVDHLRSYHEAEMDLVEYLITQPEGIWRYEAYRRLAEVQYLLDKPRASARTYEKLIRDFGDEADLDAALYALSHVLRHDLKRYDDAVRWYSRLIKEYPRSVHLEDAVFWRAECLWKLGRIRQAREEYRKYAELFPRGRWVQAVSRHLQSRQGEQR